MTAGLRLGAPGIYRAPPERGDNPLRAVRLDIAGFVGVAARGPVGEPLAVRSVAEYHARFGVGPGLLPLAVQAFFAQGGQRAWVLRAGAPFAGDAQAVIEHGTEDPVRGWQALRTSGGHPVRWLARDEGSWADELSATLTFTVRQRFPVSTAPGSRALTTAGGNDAADRTIVPPAGVQAPAGAALWIRPEDPRTGDQIRWIEESAAREIRPGTRAISWTLDQPLPTGSVTVSLLAASIVIADHDPTSQADGGTRETFEVGLSPRHPLWLATVVDAGSLLVRSDPAWAAPALSGTERITPPIPRLAPIGSRREHRGRDRFGEITAADLLGRSPDQPPDDDPACERAHRGAERLARIEELGLLVVPDLAWKGVDPGSVTVQKPDPPPDEFTPCTGPQPRTTLRVSGAEAVYLDGRRPDELLQTRARQRWLTELADLFGQFVVLLDVPQGLPSAAVASWRAAFDSSYAAAYHPWPGMIPDSGSQRVPGPIADPGAGARFVPPSAFAAGIIAARERAAGLAAGPANQLAAGAVTISDRLTDAEHAVLHPEGINVFRAERDGFRLTAARTLSLQRDYRQLTVRRLLTMLRLTLDRESQWVVFEPNTAQLRAVLVLHISDLLRGQFQAGAFAGATEAESYFVRAGDDLNPPESIALGRMVFEVGVAPSEPLEFIVLRLTQDGGAAVVEEVPSGNP
jgi:hypothetical protein